MTRGNYLATAMMIFPLAFGGVASAQTAAQQITGTPGSPSATTTIDGQQLPPQPPKFGGVINENAKDSTPLLATVCSAAQGRAKRITDHDR
jgi:hypothetical protein